MPLSWFQIRIRGPIGMRGWVCMRGGHSRGSLAGCGRFFCCKPRHRQPPAMGIGGGGKFALIYSDGLCEDGHPAGMVGKDRTRRYGVAERSCGVSTRANDGRGLYGTKAWIRREAMAPVGAPGQPAGAPGLGLCPVAGHPGRPVVARSSVFPWPAGSVVFPLSVVATARGRGDVVGSAMLELGLSRAPGSAVSARLGGSIAPPSARCAQPATFPGGGRAGVWRLALAPPLCRGHRLPDLHGAIALRTGAECRRTVETGGDGWQHLPSANLGTTGPT